MYEQGDNTKDHFYDSVRLDKGRRILAGVLHARPKGHIMIVDDDDFISNKIVAFVAANQSAHGWYVKDGYVWPSDGRVLYLYNDFSNLCGTSHIVRADLYELPKAGENATETYIKRMLGSHRFIQGHLEQNGTKLAPLPFVGAIYRVGHAGAHSRSSGLMSQYFLKPNVLCNPFRLARRLLRLRWVTPSIAKEFFGNSA
jgi:hypothetical protein